MRDLLRTATVALAACVLALLIARACSSPPPVVVPDHAAQDAARIAVEREADRRVDEANETARDLCALPLYDRLDALTEPRPGAIVGVAPPTSPRPPRRQASRKRDGGLVYPQPTATASGPVPPPVEAKPDRCAPADPGFARCPESVLDRLTLRVIDAEQRADVATIRLDEERAYRRLDADAAAVREEALRTALADAKPAPWRVPAALVGGAAVATGVALAVAGKKEAGAVVGGAGLVLGVVAVW
jgi:hypothetical protein